MILAEIHAMLTEPCNEGNLVHLITKTPRLTSFKLLQKVIRMSGIPYTVLNTLPEQY